MTNIEQNFVIGHSQGRLFDTEIQECDIITEHSKIKEGHLATIPPYLICEQSKSNIMFIHYKTKLVAKLSQPNSTSTQPQLKLIFGMQRR